MKKILFTILISLLILPTQVSAVSVQWDGNFSSQILQPLKAYWGATVKANNFTATSTTATSTFAGGVEIDGLTRLATSLTGVLRATAGNIGTGLVNLASEITGTLGLANGGTNATSFGANRVIFVNSGNTAFTSENTFVNTTTGLGKGTTTPSEVLHLLGSDDTTIRYEVSGASSDSNTGDVSSGTAINVANTGWAWTSLSNVSASDDSRASVAIGALQISDYIVSQSHGFTVPANATIDGIVAKIEARYTSSTLGTDAIVRLYREGGLVGDDKGTDTALGSGQNVDATDTYGSSTDLWGTTWTVNQINASGFGVAMASYASGFSSATSQVDHMTINVYYSQGNTSWVAGVDNGDGQEFKIDYNDTFDTGGYFTIDLTGDVKIEEDLDVGGTLTSGTANAFNVNASGAITAVTGLSGATGTYDLSSATSLEIPNGASVTTDAFGEIGADNDAWASGRGAIQAYDGTASTYLVGTLSSDSPVDGQVPTWNTGGTVTWETPSAGGGGGGGNANASTGARVFNSTDLTSISTASPIGAALTFNSEVYDLEDYHSTSTNTSRLTAPRDGYYLVGAGVLWSTTSTGQRLLTIRQGGSARVASKGFTSTSNDDRFMDVHTVVYMEAGDYVELFARSTVSSIDISALTATSPYFWIQQVDGGGAENIFTLTDNTTVEATSTNQGIGLKLDYFTATSTTATSTFSGAVDIGGPSNSNGSGKLRITAQEKATTGSPALQLNSIDSYPKWGFRIDTNANDHKLFFDPFKTGAWQNPVMVLDRDGLVGIGTTTPYAKLSVVGQVVGEYFTATSTTATSTFPNAHITTAFNFLGDYITNVTTWFRSKVDAYLTGGTGITYSAGDISFDCSEVEGTGIDCSGENITLDATGDWTGTFDGQQGSYYLDATNLTDFGIPFYNFFNATSTTALSEGTNLYYTEGRVSANTDVTANTSARHDAVTLSGTPDYITLSGQDIVRGTIDIGDDTNLSCGTNCTLTGDEISIDDAFILNTGDIGTGEYTLPNLISTNSTSTNATSTNLSVSGSFNFLGTIITNVSTWFNGLFDTQLATKTTTNLAEGTNLYYTTARVNTDAPNVTLAGTPDYITLSGQVITRALVNLASHITGTLPIANGGTGATSLNDLITLATHTTGNFIATIAGTSNEIDVSGSGSENSSVTLSLPTSIDLGGKTSFEIPNGTNPTVTTAGRIALDTTDNQLLLADSGNTVFVAAKKVDTIWKTTVASTSPAFISGGLLKVPTELDGYTMTAIRCSVQGGTSKVIAVEDESTNSTEDITCLTSVTSDDGSITNATATAAEEMYIDFGATSGAVDYVSISVFGTWTRE